MLIELSTLSLIYTTIKIVCLWTIKKFIKVFFITFVSIFVLLSVKNVQIKKKKTFIQSIYEKNIVTIDFL